MHASPCQQSMISWPPLHADVVSETPVRCERNCLSAHVAATLRGSMQRGLTEAGVHEVVVLGNHLISLRQWQKAMATQLEP